MKKILALIVVFMMLPMTNVFAADTPNEESSTGAAGGTQDSGETRHDDTLEQMYNSYRHMDDTEWTETMHNKDLFGYKNDEGQFGLGGLMNELFFDVNGMLPGDTVTKYIRIKNTSKTDYNLYFEANRKNPPQEGEVDLFDVLNLEIKEIDDTLESLVYEGRIFNENIKRERFKLGTVKADQEPIILKATVTMDSNAGNEYENKSADVDWIFIADGDIDPSEKPGTDVDPGKRPHNPNTDPSDEPDPGDKPGPGIKPKPTGGGSVDPGNPDVSVNENANNQKVPVSDIGTVDLADYSGKGEYNSNVSKTGEKNYLLIYLALAVGSFVIGYVLFSKGKKNGKER